MGTLVRQDYRHQVDHLDTRTEELVDLTQIQRIQHQEEDMLFVGDLCNIINLQLNEEEEEEECEEAEANG